MTTNTPNELGWFQRWMLQRLLCLPEGARRRVAAKLWKRQTVTVRWSGYLTLDQLIPQLHQLHEMHGGNTRVVASVVCKDEADSFMASELSLCAPPVFITDAGGIKFEALTLLAVHPEHGEGKPWFAPASKERGRTFTDLNNPRSEADQICDLLAEAKRK